MMQIDYDPDMDVFWVNGWVIVASGGDPDWYAMAPKDYQDMIEYQRDPEPAFSADTLKELHRKAMLERPKGDAT